MMAFTLLFAISIPTQLVAQNKKLIKEAKDGNGEAQAMLSTYYFKGIEGFDRDIEQAKFWAGKAEESARNGSWEAQAWLVSRLFHGDQVYRKNLNLALRWADATLNNNNLQGENRKVFVEFRERIVNEIEKEKESKLEEERAKLSPSDLAEQIIRTIRDFNFNLEKELALFSEEEKLTNTLLSMAKSDERREALLKVYDFLNLVANSYKYGVGLAQGHKGMERGKKEIELAEQIKKRLNEEGDITFGFLPGQREDDIVVRSADERVLGAGTKIRRKNGVLTVNNNGGMTLTMDDGTVFNGYFKEQVNFYGDSNQYGHLEQFADAKLLLAEEFTPYDGVIQYADGKSDELNMGKSVTAQVKAAKAAYEAEMKAVKSELAKLSQKYGAATINSLKTTGALKVGYSMTMLNDYLKVCNRYRTARVKAENGQDDPLGFYYFEPTVSEVLKYGKTANRVKLGGTRFANEFVLANCMVANGKIAAIYQNTTILAIKDL